MRVGQVDGLGERVEGAGVDVARRRSITSVGPVARGQGPRQGVQPDPALAVGRRSARTVPEPRPSRCTATSIVACRSCDAITRTRGAPWSPASSTSQPAPASTACRRGGEPGEVGHLQPPVTNPTAASAGRPSRSITQRAGSLLQGRRGRSRRPQPVVLVPRRDQPVRGERRRVRAADDESEEAAGAHRRETGLGERGEGLEHRLGGTGSLGHGGVHRGEHRLGGGQRGHRTVHEGVEVVGGERRRPGQESALVGAGASGFESSADGGTSLPGVEQPTRAPFAPLPPPCTWPTRWPTPCAAAERSSPWSRRSSATGCRGRTTCASPARSRRAVRAAGAVPATIAVVDGHGPDRARRRRAGRVIATADDVVKV